MSMEEVGQAVAEIFGPSQEGSAASLIQASLARTQEMIMRFDSVVGADNTQEHVDRLRMRLTAVVHALGEAANGIVGIDDEVQHLLTVWGVGQGGVNAEASGATVVLPVSETTELPEVVQQEVDASEDTKTRQRQIVREHELYNLHPWLRPQAFASYGKWSEYVCRLVSSGNTRQIVQEVTRKAGLPGGSQYASVGMAAGSILSVESVADQSALDQLKRNEAIAANVRDLFLRKLPMLLLSEGKTLDPHVLAQCGFEQDHLPEHLQDLANAPDVPLDVLIMATDIAAQNKNAVIKFENPSKGVRRDVDIQELNTLRAPYLRLTSKERARLRDIEKDIAYNEDLKGVSDATRYLQGYLERHYEMEIRTPQVRNFLAECRIAERVGYPNENTAVNHSLLSRVNIAWSQLSPAQAVELLPIYNQLIGL